MGTFSSIGTNMLFYCRIKLRGILVCWGVLLKIPVLSVNFVRRVRYTTVGR